MELLTTISGWLWNPLAYVALGIGVFFTLLTKGVQFRRLPDMIRQLRSGKSGDSGLSSFQTLALTLSSRVGVGSIAGVATAVATGGPGAVFWMAVTGLVGSTCAYAEAVLAQVYKRRIQGEDRGGMPYYIRYGLRAPKVAATMAMLGIMVYGFVLPGIQVNNIASSTELAFGIQPWVTGLIITAMLGFVIVGGTRRIVNVAQAVVPVMALGYVLTCLVILGMNAGQVPHAVTVIVTSAMGTDQVFGGMVGYAVAWGVRRAVFASSTGLGEGTFASAAAQTSHPGKQGIVQAFSIYIDVLMICSLTGLTIVVTGAYNVKDPSGGYLVEHVPGVVAGPNFMQEAIDTGLPGWGSAFVAIAVLLFAFTTQVFYFYAATTNVMFLFGERGNRFLEGALRLGALGISFVGAVVSADTMWAAGDIVLAFIGWLNMSCVLLLTPVVRKVIRDYDRQRREGIDPVFAPEQLGISNAEYWVKQKAHTSVPVRHAT
ncbi:alanine/glycine:cation symporter family protein [Streptomyces sp. NPDC057363]|uniref:alanine/glycine:cation symporter family protein n=1 Tax=Streptomyces sp. NPDC057363 TaxID=3346107 RepID=UPI0036419830